jgi:hypothetical protein
VLGKALLLHSQSINLNPAVTLFQLNEESRREELTFINWLHLEE